jgi:hypothetical protein
MTLYIPALRDLHIVVAIETVTAWLSLHHPALPAFLVVAPIVSVFALRRYYDMSWIRATFASILFTAWLIAWPIVGMFLLMKFAA